MNTVNIVTLSNNQLIYMETIIKDPSKDGVLVNNAYCICMQDILLRQSDRILIRITDTV